MPSASHEPAPPALRPTVSPPVTDATGRWFEVTFLPGQALPRHRASSPVVLEALEGAGVLQVDGLGPRAMIAGTSVQVEANVPHDVLAGPVGLRLRVRSVAPCCESC